MVAFGMIAIEVLLGIAALLAAAGYVRTALNPFSDTADMPPLLTAVVLALGFLGLLLK